MQDLEQLGYQLVNGGVFELALLRPPHSCTLRKCYHDIVWLLLEESLQSGRRVRRERTRAGAGYEPLGEEQSLHVVIVACDNKDNESTRCGEFGGDGAHYCN